VIPIIVRTLILSHPPAPSVLILQPKDEEPENGVGRIVPIWMGSPEAAAIGMALEGIRPPRPITHDLFMDTIASLDAFIEQAVISDVRGKTFFAQIYLRQYGRLIVLDARPSDAIPLALKEQAPLYMSEEVLQKASFPYIFKSPEVLTEEDVEGFREFVNDLEPSDFTYDELPGNLEQLEFGPDDLFVPGRLEEMLRDKRREEDEGESSEDEGGR